tara:strand:- start:1216 stop:1593 length:378 start_codon:yes stop_codon:yes gene_type:complete
MNQNFIKLIGMKQMPRKDAYLACLNQLEGLDKILDRELECWIDIDRWGDLEAQQWVFDKSMRVYRGKKIDIRCICCDYTYVSPHEFKNRLKNQCYGIKIAYMIEKVLDEIVLAKARRDSDGTYST